MSTVRLCRLLALLAVLECGGDPTGPGPGATGIVFSSSRTGNDEVYVMDLDGANPVNGTKIAFVTTRAQPIPVIFVMNANGTNPLRLMTNTAANVEPSWAPGGTMIAFSAFRARNFEIYAINSNGTGEVRLTTTDTLWAERGPAWSPDSTKIAFSSTRDGNLEIYVMNANGSGAVNLTNNAATDGGASWVPLP